MGGDELEPERPHLVEVPHRAVGDDAGAAERLVDVGLHLPPLGPLSPRLVEVVDDDDARLGDCLDEVPVAEDARAIAVDGRRLRADQRGDRVAHERTELGEERPQLARHVPLVPRAEVEGLDGVRHASIQVDEEIHRAALAAIDPGHEVHKRRT